MGAWVIASVLAACFLLTEEKNVEDPVASFKIQPIPVRLSRNAHGIEVTKGLLIGDEIHSAVPRESTPEAANYQPYDVKVYKFSEEDARNPNHYIYSYNNEVGSYETGVNYNEFASIEHNAEAYNQNVDTAGYDHYKTSTSFALEGPKQLETITTHSYHKESEPFDVSGFQKPHKNEEDEQTEVHYHQHKHLHKHNHRQEHLHKHDQEHKHEHGHSHDHHGQHDHKHDAQHKHIHNSNHRHAHKGQHSHNHRQEHKHSHQASHKHDHKHKQDHKHDHQHAHKHSHHGEHKHSHRGDHKHDHHHGHKHESKHQHKHDHKAQHKHHHGHKDEHKHQHRDSHYHKHSSHHH